MSTNDASQGNHAAGRVRTCDTTGLPVCLDAQLFIRLNAVLAVVHLLVGGIAALLLALTRWPAVHLLPADWFYRVLTLHGLNMLIYWMLFMEVAILYFAGTTLLNSRLFSKPLAWLSFLMMLVGAWMNNIIVLMGKGDVLMTSYAPLQAHPLFYLGIILVAVGTLLACANFFGCVYISKRDKTYKGSMPLVAFGALTAAIIAVLTLLTGAAIYVPAFAWSMGWIESIDAGVYRLVWWGLGHPSQQVNVAAMIAVWYFMSNVVVGGKALNEAISRGAFVLYILFINLAAAHHLLVDPGLSSGWKIWNTSYAMYLAVLASMLHGFTVPSSVEVAMRQKGHTKGLFGWVFACPWRNPGFSAAALSVVIFGFIGGITGVTLGTQQINIIAHNTLRIPGHFHSTVVGGATLAFMGLAYYVVPLFFQREYSFKPLVRIQPYVFAAGILMLSFGMSLAGSYGVPRRHWDVEFSGAQLSAGFDPGIHLWLGLLGIGGVCAFLGLMIFVLTTVHAVFLGRSNAGQPMEDWGTPSVVAGSENDPAAQGIVTKGTFALVLLLLACFIIYYFANWQALGDVWPVR